MPDIRKLLLCLAVACSAAGFPASAQAQQNVRSISLLEIDLTNNRPEELSKLKNNPNLRELEEAYSGPDEPVMPKVKFYEFDKPDHAQGLAESLVHGVTIGLPPEYDHYGYELRRYMRAVGTIDVYKNRAALDRELMNIKRSHVVFKHWRQKLIEDIAAADKRIKEEKAGSKVITTHKLNAEILRNFMIETQAWINANEAFLEFLKSKQGTFLFERGRLSFTTVADRARFMELYETRARALKQMHGYDPFRIMVY